MEVQNNNAKNQTSTDADELYVLQQFDVNAEDYTSRIFNMVLSAFSQLFNESQMAMQESFNEDLLSETSEEFQPTVMKFIKDFHENLEFRSEALETYLSKMVFYIRPNTLLPDGVLHKEYTDSNQTLQETNQEIENTVTKIIKLKHSNAEQKEKIKNCNALELQLENLQKELDNLEKITDISDLKLYLKNFYEVINS